ncbi:FAD-binding domain-containing protein [Myriangium duriaei CBS 260.36]|uniref:FAD-binding domain-containing protein n=1 Tax=Myriangium duriaei CBS 260.36 TaxID=1168546 RepID=A0A9P4IUP1_9PEZI|nr:FAD-binding domain-containing protein [Myriangium duriaei CBS 260.36]
MRPCVFSSSLLACFTTATAFIEGTCTETDSGLKWLASKISKDTAISCQGQPLQLHNANRYWSKQNGKNASVVVYPTSKHDVAFAVKASRMTALGDDFAFVSGAHGQTNASSACGFIIDLSWLNSSSVVTDARISDANIPVAIAYQGGAVWADIQKSIIPVGYTAVGARVGNVGAGGFSTGGGIGYLAGALGYASDRLKAMEVVLMDGSIVNATKTNKHNDLFWALQGGGGQFGIVTTFYQEAAIAPKVCDVSVNAVEPADLETAYKNTVDFFNNNKDPYALMYFVVGYDPVSIITGPLALDTVLVTLRFADPYNGNQKTYNETFNPVLAGLNTTTKLSFPNLEYTNVTSLLDPFFPYGFRHGFYGPQTQSITVSYLRRARQIMADYITKSTAANDPPASTVWALQYMYPGLNGNLPVSDCDTAWPHAAAGHQTLFSPTWSLASNDGVMRKFNDRYNSLTRTQQSRSGAHIYDYPNYISPGVQASMVWGNNVRRLISVKEKYDPDCRIHQGNVFASKGCLERGSANMYAS